MILTTIFLCLSLTLNIFLFIYIRWLIKNVVTTSEGFGELFDTLEQFSTHIEQVYNLETFYGDETLESLLKHTAAMIEEIEKYSSIYSLTTELEEFEEEDEEDEEEEELYSVASEV